MPAAYRSIYVKFEANTQKLGTALKQIDSEATSVNQNLKEVNKGLKLDPGNTELLNKKFSLLADGIQNTEKRLKMLKDAEKQASDQLSKTQKGTEEYKDLEAQIESLNKEIERSNTKLANYQREIRNTASEMTDNLKKAAADLKDEFSEVAGVIAKAEAALAAYTAASVKTGTEFNAAMSQVAATTGTTSGTAEYEKMSAAAKEMGETTSYTAANAASALNALAQAGYNADEAVSKLPDTLILAKAGGLELANAAKIVTNSMSALKLEDEDLNRLIDELAVTAQKSNTNIAELGEAIKVAGGTVSMTGQSMETMYTQLGMLANNGIVASEAGTHLRNALLALAAPSDKGAAALEKLDISLTDGVGNMRDYGDILTDLNAKLDEIYGKDENNAARTEQLKEIFKVTDLTAINAMLSGTADNMQKLRSELDNAKGAADQMSKTMADNLAGDIDILKSSAEGLQLAIADKLDPAMRKAAQDGTDFFSALTDKVKGGDLGETFEKLGETINKLLNTGLQNASKWLPVVVDLLVEVAEHADDILALYISMQAYAKSKAIITSATELVSSVIALKSAIGSANTAQQIFNATAAANPIGAIATAAAAVIAALTFVIMKTSETIDVTNSEFAKASREVQEYVNSIRELNSEISETKRTHEKNIEEIEKENRSLSTLTDTVSTLAEKQELTDGEYEKLHGYIEKLNEAVPGLNLAFDNQTNSLNMTREAMQGLVASYEAYQEMQARIDYGADLSRQQVELSDKYDEAKRKYNEAVAQRKELQREIKVAEQAALRAEWNGTTSPFSQDDIEELHKKLKEAENNVAELGVAYVALGGNLRDVNEKIETNNEALEGLTEKSKTYTQAVEEQTDAEDKASAAADKAARSEEELNTAYQNAKTATSAYKSELKDLMSVLENVQKGTAYSTSQILDLIEKYPELTAAIHRTADGYIIEANAIETLTQARANDMVNSVQMEIAATEAQLSAAMHAGDTELMNELRLRYGQLQEMKSAYIQIAEDIGRGRIYSGSNGGTSSSYSGGTSYSGGGDYSSDSDDYADYLKERKANAQAEIAELERLYKLEEISATEYYERLMDITEKYYGGVDELREEYIKNETKVYEGLKKAQEDELANAKKLEDQYRALKAAEDDLARAKSRRVQVYSGAAGFHVEEDSAAIEKAQQTLADKNYDLTETLLKNAKFGGQSLSERLKSIGLAQIKDLLPDLSGLKLPSLGGGSAINNNTQTRNVTYNGGGITVIIQGSADEKTLQKATENIREAVRAEIDAFLDEENAARQTGGF